jgi:hypothetical protein
MLAVVLALGCGGNTPNKQTGGTGGREETGGSTGNTGGTRTGGSSGNTGGNTGGSTGGSGGTGGSTGGSGGVDASIDGAVDGSTEDAAVDMAPAPDLAPDVPPPMPEMPRAPWLGRDIGPTGAQTGGVVLVTTPNGGQNYDLYSSGTTGIGGTADAFFYMYQSVTGPGVISARVVSLNMTGPNSAGGLMIRESLMPDAAMVFVGPTGDGTAGGKVIVRKARGEAATAVPMDTTLPGLKAANATMLRLVREGNTVRVYAGAPNTIESDAALVGNMVTLTLQNANVPLLYGVVSTSGDAMTATRARFNELALHNLGSRPVTAGFTHYAIGTSGSSAIWGANNRLTVSSNGQPWGAVMGTSRDFLGFAYERNNDSNSLRVLVESQTLSDPNSRVAVMIRDVNGNGLPRSATTIALSLTQGVGLVLERRAASNDNSELEKVATKGAVTAPLWLRLDKAVIPRPGDPLGTTDTFVSAYYTTDNNGNPRLPWTFFGSSFVFPATNANPPGLGVAVASYSPTAIHSATVNVQTGVAQPPPDGGLVADASPDSAPDAGAEDAAVDAAAGN